MEQFNPSAESQEPFLPQEVAEDGRRATELYVEKFGQREFSPEELRENASLLFETLATAVAAKHETKE